MSVYISSHTSGHAWLSDIAANLLPSNNWFAVKNAEFEKLFQIPAGGYIGLVTVGNELKLTAFEIYSPQLGIIEQSPFPGLPGLALPTGPVNAWTVINDRRICAVLRSNGVYYSFYAGLLKAFGSVRTYPFPAFVGGSLGGSAFPFMAGGSDLCPKVCVPDGTFQVVGGDQGLGLSSFATFDRSKLVSYVHPFDGKFKRIGRNLDGSVTLYRALVVSSAFAGSVRIPVSGEWIGIDDDRDRADDGQWLGYLDGVFACPVGLVPGSVFSVAGVDYLAVQNLGVAGELFALELS